MTKSKKTIPEGVVLIVTEDATVTEVIHDTFDFFSTGAKRDQSFIKCLKSDSVKKGCHFVESIIRNGVAYRWELYIEKQDNTSLFNFSGVKTDKGILLIGSPDPDDTEKLMGGLMEMNNEQINKLRLFMKKHQDDFLKKNDWKLYDDMSELNNELANTQRELTKKTTELERTNELKNQMMGMAAHDLRNPLMLIQNYALFLIEDHQEEAFFTVDQYQLIKKINRSSEYMVQIIDDLLDMSAFESGSINLVIENNNLVDLMEEAVSLSRSSAKKKDIDIITHLPDSPINKMIDGHKFRQVLDNLLSNAVKYSNPGTKIEIGIKYIDEAESVAIFVKDQGQGIPKNEIPHLFKPFSQISVTSTAGEKSTGLGLAIVQKIVEAHGGKIEVQSEVGVGSTFIVKIS